MLASPNLIGFSKQYFKEEYVFQGNNGGFRSHQGAEDGCHPGFGRPRERERDKEANKLRRRSRQTILRINFSQLEEGYAPIKEIYNRFTSKREDWIELLGTKEDGEPTYSERGTPESRYNPITRICITV